MKPWVAALVSLIIVEGGHRLAIRAGALPMKLLVKTYQLAMPTLGFGNCWGLQRVLWMLRGELLCAWRTPAVRLLRLPVPSVLSREGELHPLRRIEPLSWGLNV